MGPFAAVRLINSNFLEHRKAGRTQTILVQNMHTYRHTHAYTHTHSHKPLALIKTLSVVLGKHDDRKNG